MRSDGAIRCWGDNDDGKLSVPAGEYSSVSAGGDHSCGLGSDGSIACWGSNDSGQVNAPRGEYLSVSAGGDHTCGLRSHGRVRCWGDNDDGQVRDPSRGVHFRIGRQVPFVRCAP